MTVAAKMLFVYFKTPLCPLSIATVSTFMKKLLSENLFHMLKITEEIVSTVMDLGSGFDCICGVHASFQQTELCFYGILLARSKTQT